MTHSCELDKCKCLTAKLEQVATESLELVCSLNNLRDIDGFIGGILCLREQNSDSFLIEKMITGSIEPKDEETITQFAHEQANRNLEMLAARKHVSSYQSRDFSKKLFPGAIIAHHNKKQICYSFHGMIWDYDEAIVLVIAVKMGHLTLVQAKEIAQISKNNIFTNVANHLEAHSANEFFTKACLCGGMACLLGLFACAALGIG